MNNFELIIIPDLTMSRIFTTEENEFFTEEKEAIAQCESF